MTPHLLGLFPALDGTAWRPTSVSDVRYNCIAWGVGEDHRRWDPHVYYWPAGVKREDTLDRWIEALGTEGFNPETAFDPDADVEWIVIYCLSGQPKHVARHMADDTWTSKLGDFEDIEHPLEALVGAHYGSPEVYLARRR